MYLVCIKRYLFKILTLTLSIILLSACAGKTTKPEIVLVKDVNKARPIVSALHKADYDKALSLMESKKIDSAQAIFKDLINIYPELIGAYVNLSLSYRAQANDVEAEKYLKKALEINSNHIDALIQMASLSQKKGKFKEVERYLLTAKAVDKTNETVQYNLGVLYELYLQQYDEAIEHYENYLALSSNNDTETVKLWIKLLERK